MPKFFVQLSNADFDLLLRHARLERRSTRAQAEILLERALRALDPQMLDPTPSIYAPAPEEDDTAERS